MGNPDHERLDEASSTDRLIYIADLLGELQTLVQAESHATLEGLLALSQAEARRLAKSAAV